ncbi:YfhO family protein [Lagierella sp.]|uniref:YfhO family protein n=1 Tax=Lagierella sp. TaxID=2849657 RepID=UPI00262020DD|nr:YfhO family protein [Lagierella sp.]
MKEFYERLKNKRYFYFTLAFLVPFLTFIFIYIFSDYYPIGRKQILIVDAYHQYYQFFLILRDKLLNGGGFFYTFVLGLGSDFLGLSAYYLLSPINIFLIAIPKSMVIVFYELAIALKIGLMGLTFSIYLYWIYQKKDYSLVAFSLIYSLSGFVAGYYWNIMWLDVLILFPLVILGVKNIVVGDSYRLYFFSLLGCFLLNYYISVFVSLAVVLFYFGFNFILGKDLKSLVLKGLKTLYYSICCALIGAFILLPTAIGLSRVYKSASPFSGEVKLIKNFHDLMANSLAFNYSTVRDGLPNIYSGLIIIFFIFIYLFTKGILRREKFATSFFIIFLYLSTNVNVLDYIWHGFRYSNMLPSRFTFILAFVVGVVCYKTFKNLEYDNIKLVLPFGILALLIIYFLGTKRQWQINVANILLMTGYITLSYFVIRKKKIAKVLLCGLLSLELIINICVGVFSGGTTDYYDFIKYQEEIDALKSGIKDKDFYRSEVMDRFTFNDPALYSYNGLSMFSSTLDKRISIFLENMGHSSSPLGNRIYYNYTTPILNSFLNIKYLYQKETDVEVFGFDRIRQVGAVTLLENRFSLPLAFEPRGDINRVNYKYDNIENQEELLTLLSGREDKIFTPVERIGQQGKDLEITESLEDKVFYTIPDEDEKTLILEYEAPEDGYYYFDSDSIEDNKFTVDIYGELTEFDIRNKNITGGIFMEKGTYFKIKLNIIKDDDGQFGFRVFKLNEEAFIRSYEEILKNLGENIKIEKEIVTFDINTDNGKILTSIPYNEGWRAFVNGEEVETEEFYEAFLMIEGEKGKNHVKLKYSPSGFNLGMGLSISTIIMLMILKKKTLAKLIGFSR